MNKKNDIILFTILFSLIFILRRQNLIDGWLFLLITCLIFLILILFFAIYFNFKYKNSKVFLIGSIASFVADIFLTIIREGNYVTEIGLASFVVAQIGYMFFINIYYKEKRIFRYILRISLSILFPIIVAIIFKENTNILFILVVIYATNLIINLIESIKIRKIFPLLFLGFILFFMCDLALLFTEAKYLGIIDLSNVIPINIFFIIPDSSWLFYMPCQYLLVLSLVYNKRESYDVLYK